MFLCIPRFSEINEFFLSDLISSYCFIVTISHWHCIIYARKSFCLNENFQLYENRIKTIYWNSFEKKT